MIDPQQSLDIGRLLAGYRARAFTPGEVMDLVLARIEQQPDRHAWITRLDRAHIDAYLAALADKSVEQLPLYGIPFAIKDNIDLAGVPTTAACPDYAYTPARSAFVVQRLIDAGAIPVGKTNLDQFATGLVGARSPYGACENSFDRRYVSGGSSAGSAVTVATGVVSFSLGTDTAGSGRVPAAFNNLLGLKPSLGLLSSTGVVPACRSLDTISVFALCAADAGHVFDAAAGFDSSDPYSRTPAGGAPCLGEQFRFGVPAPEQLEFFGNAEAARLFDAAVERLRELGGEAVEIDFAPFLEAARLLYEGPWVTERYVAIEAFINGRPEALYPVTYDIISKGAQPSAADAFRAQYRLQALRRATETAWAQVDVIVTPTAGTIYQIGEVNADPVRLNANLGYYTNFMNLLDLAAVAVPAGFQADGLPFGVTLVGRAFTDSQLLALADRLHRAADLPLGATGAALPAGALEPAVGGRCIPVAVCGAHLQGLPLNRQLTERGARLHSRTRTAPRYRLYALAGGPPQRPGLVRDDSGAAIEVEVWEVPAERFGSFVAGIPAPLAIGKVELADGAWVPGFVCEAYAAGGAEDITALGGWRNYLARASA
ncbi:MAG: allophanate hydrolase [Gammaproteobacteria bacterium]